MDAARRRDHTRRDRFERLADEVYEPLQRYVRRRAESDSVDDIVSDTMLTLWRRLEDVPPNAQLPWAYGVARRTIANHRRAAGRHLTLVRRIQAEPNPAPTADVPLDSELHVALDSLSPSDRELLRLWAWEQLDPAEIAITLGLTPNAAAIRLHRAKKKLGENLAIERKNETSSGHSHRERRKEERS
ncbi:MAG: sigma-70 family RNA polymerase sigma factor [Acidimicrobiia bacterium]